MKLFTSENVDLLAVMQSSGNGKHFSKCKYIYSFLKEVKLKLIENNIIWDL